MSTPYVVIIGNPYADNEPSKVVGPFASQDLAEIAREHMKLAGEHPDAFFGIVPIVGLDVALDEIEDLAEFDDVCELHHGGFEFVCILEDEHDGLCDNGCGLTHQGTIEFELAEEANKEEA